jgi:hypothetical protein
MTRRAATTASTALSLRHPVPNRVTATVISIDLIHSINGATTWQIRDDSCMTVRAKIASLNFGWRGKAEN